MFKFFDIIVSFLQTVVDYVLSGFQMLLYLFGYISQGFVYVGTCIAYLPTWVYPFCFAVVSFSIILFILNR